MKKYIVFLLAAFVVSGSCHKYDGLKSDAIGNLYFYGRLFIRDSVLDNGIPKPLLAETPIQLTYSSDTSQVLFSTKTTADGYFTFLNLTPDTHYTILAETTVGADSFKSLYSVSQDILADVSKSNLTPLLQLDNKKQNGVLYTVRDLSTKGLITGCNVCFFSSPLIYQKDSCEYASFSLATNTNGKVLKTNLSPGRYYVLFKKAAGTLLLNTKDTLAVPNVGIVRKDIFLQ